MDVPHILYCAVTVLLLTNPLLADREFMVKESENYIVPLNYKTKITCEMNIIPDTFEWRFYPLPEREAYNDKFVINLGTANYLKSPMKSYNSIKARSSLNINLGNDTHAAGDYQCLAHYGASVVASVPWRLTIARIGKYSEHKPTNIDVREGNTVSWRCEPPNSSPPTSIDYYYKNKILVSSNLTIQNTSLIIPNVTLQDSGVYTCVANNMILNVNYTLNHLNLSVNNHPRTQGSTFIVEPKKEYIVNKGDSIFMECSAIGNPIPKVSWKKKDGNLPSSRSELVNGGFKITNIQASDDGVYICTHFNHYGEVTHEVTLIYNEEPSIDCYLNNTDVKQGENLDLSCEIKGTPEPIVSWFLNGKSVINDTKIEAVGNKIYFRPIEKRHAGNLQCFASNRVKTNYKSISIIVIPLSTSIDLSMTTMQPRQKHPGRKNNGNRKSSKHTMIPPSKPVVSRLTDESVLVRWNVSENNGLPIQFFKVQYSELDGHYEHRKKGTWKTTNADISPHIKSYEVTNLKPDHYYKFRIAAVYSNNDNKRSANSDKFLLTRGDFDKRNPLPIPLITRTESVNSSTVRIYWNFTRSSNITVKGFFINYLSASSAADYMKVTVDGADVNSFELSHLQPESVYDIKMQSFTSESASDFSAIMKARTLAMVVTTTQSSHTVTNHTTNLDNGSINTLHIIIAGSVIGGALLICTVALFFICKKWKKKKNAGDRDKPAVTVDHHIQNDGNDYVVSPKSIPRTNGCALPPNRITITANPLADADSKTQNMIEMSCLTTQNNNCALPTQTQQPSVSGQEVPAHSTDRSKNKMKNREKIKRTKHNVDSNVSGENYV